MERRDFLKLAVGIAAGSAALATSVNAAPLAPQSIAGDQPPPAAGEEPRPAVTTKDEVDRLQPEQVRWGHHWHHRWHRRWHWHRHHWHRRWHRRHW